MDQKTKEMIQGWLKMHRGDKEAVARYIARELNIGGIRQARRFVEEASRGFAS